MLCIEQFQNGGNFLYSYYLSFPDDFTSKRIGGVNFDNVLNQILYRSSSCMRWINITVSISG